MTELEFAPQRAMSGRSLSAKKTCCRTGCLHCPYGFTLKQYGLHFLELKEEHLPKLEPQFEQLDINDVKQHLDEYRWVTLKGYACALIRVDKLFVTELYLLEGFEEQGLVKELIESYYFN